MGDPLVRVEPVEVAVHPFAAQDHVAMVLRSGQRRKHKELDQVDRQLALHDLDVAQQRLPGIGRESGYVARYGQRARLAPAMQHDAIFGDLVLAFLDRHQVVGGDVFQSDEDLAHAGPPRLLDEAGGAMGLGVDLSRHVEHDALVVTKLDQAVEIGLPQPVADKIVVGDEERGDALGVVLAHDPLEIVGGAETALAALHVDDGAERALERTAAAEIEARVHVDAARELDSRQEGRRLAFEAGQIVEVVVERLQRARPGGLQHLVEAAILGLAGEDRDAHVHRRPDLRRQLGQHGDAAGNMEAADDHRQAGGAERPCEVDGARKLRRLNADEADQRLAAAAADIGDDARWPDAPAHFVVGLEDDVDIVAEHRPPLGIGAESEQHGERVGRDERAHPRDRIAVLAIARRLDHDHIENGSLHHRHRRNSFNQSASLSDK